MAMISVGMKGSKYPPGNSTTNHSYSPCCQPNKHLSPRDMPSSSGQLNLLANRFLRAWRFRFYNYRILKGPHIWWRVFWLAQAFLLGLATPPFFCLTCPLLLGSTQ